MFHSSSWVFLYLYFLLKKAKAFPFYRTSISLRGFAVREFVFCQFAPHAGASFFLFDRLE